MNDFIHIVCLDAPAPPDYGGAIDMYYKIEALGKAGKKIILHYFDYKPQRGVEGLENYCSEVYRYPRRKFSFSFLGSPYIVASRIDETLIRRLNADTHPVLLEGLHCTGILPFLENTERVIVRMHNEEASYYQQLAGSELNFLKKLYLEWEARAIKIYQQKMRKDVKLATLSAADVDVFNVVYHFSRQAFIPCFIQWSSLNGSEGKGDYCLYHGNLSVAENEAAAMWLAEHVFSETNIPFVIAGKGASELLKKKAGGYQNVSIISDPDIRQINELIRKAHINVLPSMNSTGVKLKLLHALFEGRFVITNANGIHGSGIEGAAFVANKPAEYINLIQLLMDKRFTADDLKQRENLSTLYNNRKNAEKLIALW